MHHGPARLLLPLGFPIAFLGLAVAVEGALALDGVAAHGSRILDRKLVAVEFANDVELVQNTLTPGTGQEPGYALMVDAAGRVRQ